MKKKILTLIIASFTLFDTLLIIKVVSVLAQTVPSPPPTASSHQPAKSLHSFHGNKMTLDYQILIGQEITPAQKNQIENIIDSTFDEINKIYNKWNPDSEISKINQSKAHHPIALSAEMESFLIFIDHIVLLTEGKFDPTIEPLQQLWKSHLAQGSAPSAEEIQKILPVVGWHNVHLKNGTLTKEHDQTSLDLGGIAKGYCVDLIAERLIKAGFENIFVNWEGEIRANGSHPENRPWKVMVSRLNNDDPEKALAFIELHDESIATSGDYIQNWEIKQADKLKTYFHIIDPSTGWPMQTTLQSVASATTIANSCALTDALATAAMMFPTKIEAGKWLEKVKADHPELRYQLYSRDEN